VETLRSLRTWLDETRAAVDSETFFQLMKARDLEKVRKGALTINEAMRNDADLRAMPAYETYRYQRNMFEHQAGTFSQLDAMYRKALRDDAQWRDSNEALLQKAREDFASCGLPD
jgi:hypothetical protein